MSKYNSNNCIELTDDGTFFTIYAILNLKRFKNEIDNIEWLTHPQYTLYYAGEGLPTELIAWGHTTTLLPDGCNEFKELVFNL